MGLRELKKAKMRKHISDVATRLFMEKGFHEVTVDEIARAAEVSVPTLFKYFPHKVALVFDEDDEREARLVAAVKERKTGTSVLDALYELGLQSPIMQAQHRKDARAFLDLIRNTPELMQHSRESWLHMEKSLAVAIQKDPKVQVAAGEAEVIAHYILEALHRCTQAGDTELLKRLFDILRTGCPAGIR